MYSVDKYSTPVALGLRAKTGRAVAVVVGGPSQSPSVFAKLEIRLVDAKNSATYQPYHEVMELPWEEAQKAARKTERVIEKVAQRNVAALIGKLKAEALTVKAVGIVGAKDRDLSRIGNYHIRAHAAEGILFRRVLDLAAETNGLPWRAFPEREFDEILKTDLGAQADQLKVTLAQLGRSLSPPWRTDEKLAAAAAWMVLHGK